MVITSPIGKIEIVSENEQVYSVNLYSEQSLEAPETSFERRVADEFERYFSGDLLAFTLPIHLSQTQFRNRVCLALADIPYGETQSYGELAQKLNSVARAIGGACRHNPLPIILPCHRVVAQNGIGGFSGATSGAKIDSKSWLLNHEQSVLALSDG